MSRWQSVGHYFAQGRRRYNRANYRLPLARLWVMQSIWQFLAELPPPLLHAETWSASISSNL